MKAISDLWNSPNTDATNSSSFSGLPGGGRFSLGPFGSIGELGHWWSSTEKSSNPLYVWIARMKYDDGTVHELYGDKPNGFSVRCLRD